MTRRTPLSGGEPLRIVLIGPARFHVTEPYAGGLEAFLGRLSTSLGQLGHHVTVIAGVAAHPTELVGRRDVADSQEEWARDEAAVAQELDRVIATQPPDVIHNNSPYPMAFDYERAATSFVTTFHTPPLPSLVQKIQQRSDAFWPVLVTPSTTCARAWETEDVHTRVVLNGIDRRLFRAGPGTGGHLVWTGRIVPEKAPHLALDVADLLEMPLLIAGPVHDDDYWSAAIAPRLHRHARYVGHLDQRRTARLVGRAAASLITPQWDEPFGLVAAESLACATPIAGTARGALPELLSDQVACLSDSTDPLSLAAATLHAVRLDRSACRRASAAFSIERMVDAYMQLYTGVGTPPDRSSRTSSMT